MFNYYYKCFSIGIDVIQSNKVPSLPQRRPLDYQYLSAPLMGSRSEASDVRFDARVTLQAD